MDNKFTPVIGKDVIESLTIGMYEDSRFIFREYIQNSADQIDKAVREGLLEKNQGEIHITIDAERRKIIIEDNATGIAFEQVQPILQNIAQSTKQRGVDKGFRGIGRLGGLAYCENLIFETSFLPFSASADRVLAACTKCTKRRMFSAQARRGSKRALWG